MAALRFSTLRMSEKLQPERCVADTAILQDLNHTALMPALLSSQVNLITTPDVLGTLEPRFRLELQAHAQAGQVFIEAATTEDMKHVINEIGPANRMSVNDCLLCRIARRLNLSLLSGCERLRDEARERGIRAKSIIWVLDRLVKKGVLKPESAAKRLAELQQRNPWMNQQRTQQQIALWQSINQQAGTLVELRSTNFYSA